MSDTTIIAAPEGSPESTIFGVSIRAIVTVIVVLTICATHLGVTIGVMWHSIRKGDFALVGSYTTIGEPLYGLAYVTVGYFFGSSKGNKGKV